MLTPQKTPTVMSLYDDDDDVGVTPATTETSTPQEPESELPVPVTESSESEPTVCTSINGSLNSLAACSCSILVDYHLPCTE